MDAYQAYDWLAPKLSVSERSALDIIYREALARGVAIERVAEMIFEDPTQPIKNAKDIVGPIKGDLDRLRMSR